VQYVLQLTETFQHQLTSINNSLTGLRYSVLENVYDTGQREATLVILQFYSLTYSWACRQLLPIWIDETSICL